MSGHPSEGEPSISRLSFSKHYGKVISTQVTVVDMNMDKIAQWNSDHLPIFEVCPFLAIGALRQEILKRIPAWIGRDCVRGSRQQPTFCHRHSEGDP